MSVIARFMQWVNRRPDCPKCGKEMEFREGLGAGYDWCSPCEAVEALTLPRHDGEAIHD
jgi:hypothetical protein